ncbi:MAG: desulfoferrodoxin [Clostridioides sp.]|jgi:superoxide reductase|nr:desulfoferrodoxin [Clostridioides sp.]
MCNKPKYYKCEICGNIVSMIHDAGIVPFCCGKAMTELVANTSDGASEKHVPVIEVNGNEVTVTIGSTLHPMLEEHHIEWIILVTEKGRSYRCLNHTGDPIAKFTICEDDKVKAAYEYCNLHGLWMAEYK